MSMPSTAGIVTDADGRRVIPESRRPDGSIRPAIKVRPGYMPPEDVPKYRIPLYRRKAVAAEDEAGAAPDRTPTDSIPGAVPVSIPAVAAKVPGAVPGASAEIETTSASSTAVKNAKRREARKKAAASSAEQPAAQDEAKAEQTTEAQTGAAPVDASTPAEERDKKIRGLKKKLKQAKELQTKRDGGASLLPEQVAKVIRISELSRELEALGLGDDEK